MILLVTHFTVQVVSCLITNNCITLTCTLLDNRATTDNIQISFRVVETLGNNDIIIGLSDVRRYDLTTKFKHLYVDEIEATPTRIRSTIHSKGEDAEASRFNESHTHEKKGNGANSYRDIKTSRRVIMPPQLQKEIITRAGKRTDIPCLPGMKRKSIFDNKIDRSSRFL